jgi:hypothetical protein
MSVSLTEFNQAKGFYDLDVVGSNASNEVTAIVATIRGVNGSRASTTRRRWAVDYRLLADVTDLRSGLPEGWIVAPVAAQLVHVNIWPASINCPLTGTRTPRICWGDGKSAWARQPESERTLISFLEVARQVLNGANLTSPCR